MKSDIHGICLKSDIWYILTHRLVAV